MNHKIKNRHALLSSALLMSFSQSIHAQEPIQQVEVKAKSETDNARRDASAKTIISNAELVRFGSNSISEAMKRIPNILVVNGVIQLVGMNGSYTQILVDGEPLRGTNIDTIPMNMVDRIEIYRLGSAEFSSAAIAGTINIILKKIPREAQQQIKLSMSDAYAPITNVEWRGSDKRDKLSYALSIAAGVNRNIFGAPRLSSITVHDLQNQIISQYNTQFDGKVRSNNVSIHPEFQYKTKDGLSIRSSSSLSFYRDHVATDVTYDFLNGTPLPIKYNKDRFTDSFKEGNSNLKISDTLWENIKLDFNVSVNATYSQIDSKELNYTHDSKLDLDRTMNRVRRSGGINSTFKITIPSFDGHDIVSGWNGSRRNDNDQRFSIDSFSTLTGIPNIIQNNQTTHSIVNRWAFFVQDEWQFKKASSASLGLRWESVSVETEGNQLLPVQNSVNVWSPIVQTLWQLNDENTDRLRFGVSRTFKPPSSYQLITPQYKRINNSIENPNYRANARLKPELAWAFEAAYEHNGADKWNYNLRAVIRRIEDLHRSDVSRINDEWWRQFVNSGQAISKNISVDTQFPLKRFFTTAPDINVSFAASKNWSTVSHLPKPDNRLSPISLTLNSSLDYTAKDIPLSLGANLRYRDGNPLLINLKQRELAQSLTTLDLYGIWKFNKKTQLRLGLENVLERANVSGNQFYEEDTITTRYDTQRAYRTVRLNFEHHF